MLNSQAWVGNLGCQKHNNEEIRMRLVARVAVALNGVVGAWDVTKDTPRL